jgi:large subunit ribosomal protein L4
MALSSKWEEKNLFVIDDFKLDQIRTKQLASVLDALKLDNLLIVSDAQDDTFLEMSSRNIPQVKVIKTAGLNVYDILKYRNLLLVESSIQNIQGRLS